MLLCLGTSLLLHSSYQVVGLAYILQGQNQPPLLGGIHSTRCWRTVQEQGTITISIIIFGREGVHISVHVAYELQCVSVLSLQLHCKIRDSL